ncbi:MAG: hypothetical protein GY938_30850 [Ketobacter sp.]|nr:hypothetical protein [Ketobacter sp.]
MISNEKRAEIEEFLETSGLKGTISLDRCVDKEGITFVYKTRAYLEGDWYNNIVSSYDDLERLIQSHLHMLRTVVREVID